MLRRNLVAVCVLWAASTAPRAHAQTAKGVALDFPSLQSISAVVGDAALKSVAGHDINVITFEAKDHAGKDVPATARFLVQGGLHGNEEQASAFVLWLARRFARGESLLNSLPRNQVAIDFLPYANPDGSHDDNRYNARGVNLNRNFGVLWGVTKENPGKASFSEPETQAIRSLFRTRKYHAAVDVHGYINWIVAPSSPEELIANGKQPDRARAVAYRQWLGALRAEMPLLTGYELKTGAKLGDGGAFEDWAFWSEGTFAYCLEMETFERYVKPYRRDFNNLALVSDVPSIDLYKRYEAFIHRMFVAAIKLREEQSPKHTLAVK